MYKARRYVADRNKYKVPFLLMSVIGAYFGLPASKMRCCGQASQQARKRRCHWQASQEEEVLLEILRVVAFPHRLLTNVTTYDSLALCDSIQGWDRDKDYAYRSHSEACYLVKICMLCHNSLSSTGCHIFLTNWCRLLNYASAQSPDAWLLRTFHEGCCLSCPAPPHQLLCPPVVMILTAQDATLTSCTLQDPTAEQALPDNI